MNFYSYLAKKMERFNRNILYKCGFSSPLLYSVIFSAFESPSPAPEAPKLAKLSKFREIGYQSIEFLGLSIVEKCNESNFPEFFSVFQKFF